MTSFNPLKIYLFNDCLVRFCTETYSADKVTHNNRFAHLTSYSVNKKNQDAKTNPLQDLKQLRDTYERNGIEFEPVFAQIKDLVIKTLLSVDQHIAPILGEHANARNACFEMFSFDIMLDEKMKAWVIKTSSDPTDGNVYNVLQKRINDKKLCDAYTLVGLQPYDKTKVETSEHA